MEKLKGTADRIWQAAQDETGPARRDGAELLLR